VARSLRPGRPRGRRRPRDVRRSAAVRNLIWVRRPGTDPGPASRFGSGPRPVSWSGSGPRPVSRFGSGPRPVSSYQSGPRAALRTGSGPIRALRSASGWPRVVRRSGHRSVRPRGVRDRHPRTCARCPRALAGPGPGWGASAGFVGSRRSRRPNPRRHGGARRHGAGRRRGRSWRSGRLCGPRHRTAGFRSGWSRRWPADQMSGGLRRSPRDATLAAVPPHRGRWSALENGRGTMSWSPGAVHRQRVPEGHAGYRRPSRRRGSFWARLSAPGSSARDLFRRGALLHGPFRGDPLLVDLLWVDLPGVDRLWVDLLWHEPRVIPAQRGR
jgi:hypothetical protein